MTAPLRLGLAYLLIGVAPVVFGGRGVRETHVIVPSSLTHVEGASYIAPVASSPFAPLLVAASDDSNHVDRSTARLFENARELRPAHAEHAGIAAVGKGRFSHWTTVLYLSASDNSDPRTNGRVYRLETMAALPPMLVVAWMATVLLATAVSSRIWRPGVSAPAWWLPGLRPAVLAVASLVAIAMMTIARPGAAQVAALGIWLLVGFVAAFFAGVVLRRVSPAGFLRAVVEGSPVLMAAVKSPGHVMTSFDQRVFEASGWQGRAARIGCLTVPAGIFVATLTSAWPEWVLAQAYGGGGGVLLVAAPALWLAHVRRGWLAVLFGLTVTLVLFALPLAALWQDVTVHLNAIGGLLPFSDAQDYYFEANRLLDGHPLEWSARRPLFTAFLALLLAVTRSLSVVLAVMVALNGVATFLLAREVRRNFGAAAAVISTLILFAFYRNDGGTGVVLSENLGTLLGTAAFTALLRGVRLQDMRSYVSGTVLLTVGLMARAGSFFVLPALVVVAPVALRRTQESLRVRSAVATLVAVVLAAAAMIVWGNALSSATADTAAFSNYSQSLYGLAVGGKGWTQVRVDHPDAHEGAEIYALAYEAFRAQPSGLVRGLVKMARAYLWLDEPYHAFAFVQDGSRTAILQRACYALAVIGLAVCVWRRRDPVHAFLLGVAVGHLASIPFVPPIDAGLRVYAATTPILALLPAAAIASLKRLTAGVEHRLARRPRPTPRDENVTNRFAESMALVVVVVVMAMSTLLYARGTSTTVARSSCAAGSESLLVRMDNDATLRLLDDTSPRAISPTALRQREAQLSVGRVELRGEAAHLRAGMSLTFAYDQLDGQKVWLAGDTRWLDRSGLRAICGHRASDELAAQYGMIYVDDARPVDTSPR